ncbi:hypothetical protein SAMN05518683_10623 [Salibacterium halotolerans]|uniref:Uncharacterized protein n=1 Tax=Salibacterium halotolerans TaxID=1884432 RepID=A0A1I5QTG0_9BACI|nr:hypothetical protein SAMN05518683_10623 [Salibacterium halotolerans]
MKNWFMIVSLISVAAAAIYTAASRCMEGSRDFR